MLCHVICPFSFYCSSFRVKSFDNYKFSPKSKNHLAHQKALKANPTKQKCYYYLNKTSRSFAAVIQELDDISETLFVCFILFYVV
ncbi:unnamed protein product [Cunninghamella echinulata]